jgi:hypothetical protein
MVHNQSICSKKCVRKYRTEKQKDYYRRKNPKIEKTSVCVICDSQFSVKPKSRPKCCSKECSAVLTKFRHKAYREDPEFLEKQRVYSQKAQNSDARKKWMAENKDRLRKNNIEYVKNRKSEDKVFHMALAMRSSVSRMLKQQRQTATLKDIVSYSPEELKNHLESQFRDGMSWENYGRLGWHIDHKKPLTAFHFFNKEGNINMDELRACMSLDNLQPLWYDENIRKGGLRKMRTTFKERKAN